MKLTRSSRYVAALITLFSLLFTQLAVAAYTCPQLPTVNHATAHMQTMPAMPGCAGMDARQANLCAAHCDAGHQSLDAGAAPQVAPFIAGQLALVLPSGEPAAAELAAPATAAPLTRATAPPLAIRHCRFHI